MRRLIEIATRRRVTIAMFTVAILMFGFVSLGRLKINLLPDLSYPTLTVRTEFEGAAPSEIENLISKPIEEAVGIVKNVVKVSSIDRDAFREIPWPHPRRPEPRPSAFSAARFGTARVAVLTLSPGLTAETFDSTLANLDGVVLRCFGSGTLPSNPSFQEVLSSRIEQGLSVLAVSQCEHGGVRPGEYSASAALRRLGILDGGALTTEAAIAKLLLTLSNREITNQVR